MPLAPSASGLIINSNDQATNVGGSAGVNTPTQINRNDQATNMDQGPKTSSTVLSNANIIENKIPMMNQKAATLQTDEPTTIATDQAAAAPTTDYGTLYTQAYNSLPDISNDPQYQSDVALINSLKANGDASTTANINSIQKNYLDLTSTMQQAQEASTDKEENALLLGGSSRYAPLSTGGIMDLKTRSDIQQLSTLQDQENQKIAAVKTAQASQDYESMSKAMTELDTLRTQKQNLAKSIADSMLKTNQTAQASLIQNSQDNAIATAVKNGTTDPQTILDNLTKAGYTTATLKDITTTLENIQKATGTKSLGQLSGNVGTFYSLKNAGELPPDVASLPENQQLFAFLKAYKEASTLPKSSTAKTTTASLGKTIKSGTLTYTPADFAADSAELNNSRGTDKYVDPGKYQSLANYWTTHGGNITDFLKTYPPKDYVNPANTQLPSYLRSSTKTSGTAASSVTDPFAGT